MRCPKCGTENVEGKILCRTCGTRLRPGARPQAAPGGARGPGGVPYESDQELRRRVSFDLIRVAWVTAVVVGVGLGLGLLLR